MPIKSCTENKKPGYRFGNTNKCWTYTLGDEASRKKAKQNCIKQGYAEDPNHFKKEMSDADLTDLDLIDRIELALETKDVSN
jgi:hypothetical protein